MHREIKQLTGIERCQCRKQRIQRNHISWAFLVWAFLKRTANTIGKTVYQIKLGLLDDYMQTAAFSIFTIFRTKHSVSFVTLEFL
ncbi:hypothetical protein [Rickettsia endosymbiont of Gonocerus acuteangulatus]|uniref:hypothetical protein n=1 Tax=Rickettsia endosymbiont of Gonocerus acuteangulatus TaxID=3066266 RepID=UPI00313334A7